MAKTEMPSRASAAVKEASTPTSVCFCLNPLDATDTSEIYEIIVERHKASSTLATSNREPVEWLGLMADTLLAQSAIDRLQSASYELVLDGESYRRREKPTAGQSAETTRRRPPGRRR